MSSTAGGYIIIPQLMSGKYYLVIGFAKNQYSEQKFIIDIANRDLGFSLKQSPDQSWQLFDIINFTTLYPEKEAPAQQKEETGQVKKEALPKTAPVMAVQPKETKADAITKPAGPVTVMGTNNTVVLKTFERLGLQGLDQIYIDKSGATPDTIALFIPILLPDTVKIAEPVKRKKIIAIQPVDVMEAQPRACTVLASTEDFYKTRLDMAASTTDAAMIEAAKKMFKTKCFTVDQVKNLGVLFLSEQSRLKFFAAMKIGIADPQNFSSLVSQFTQPDVIAQFGAILKNN